MKNLIYLIAICFTIGLIGCESTQTVNPGAVSECGAKQGEACTKEKSECCHAEKCQREAAPGAVSDGQKKSDCQKKTDCDKAEANLGAVSEDCTKSKTDCTKAKTDCTKSEANLGAVSEKAPCGAAKKSGCNR